MNEKIPHPSQPAGIVVSSTRKEMVPSPRRLKDTEHGKESTVAFALSDYSTRHKEAGIGDQIFVKGVTSLEDTFPAMKLLGKEDGSEVVVERIPSYAHMDTIRRAEPVWLTPKVVRERLQLLIWTHPSFTEGGARVVSKEFHGGLSQRTERHSVSDQRLIEQLQSVGFPIVQDAHGELLMLVDAIVPAEENTNGRMSSKTLPVSPAEIGVVDESVLLPRNLKKAGFRPASQQTGYAVAIPLFEVIGMHHSNPPIETGYFLPDQAAGTISRLTKDFYDHGKGNTWEKFSDAFDNLIDAPAVGHRLRELQDQMRDPMRKKTHKEIKLELLKILSEIGFRAFPLDQGYFPNEPVFTFNPMLGTSSQQRATSLQEMSWKADDQRNPWQNFFVLLEDFVTILEHSYWNKGRVK